MVLIVAKFVVKEGEEKKFLDLIQELEVASQAEKGCIEYKLHKSVDKALNYVIVEKWKDEVAIDEHNNTKHFTSVVPRIREIADAEVDIFKPI